MSILTDILSERLLWHSREALKLPLEFLLSSGKQMCVPLKCDPMAACEVRVVFMLVLRAEKRITEKADYPKEVGERASRIKEMLVLVILTGDTMLAHASGTPPSPTPARL